MSKRWLFPLLPILLLILGELSTTVSATESNEAYIYISYEYRSPEVYSRVADYFEVKNGWRAVYYNLDDSSTLDRFLHIIHTLEVNKVNILPPDACISCLLSHSTWREIYLMYASPLIGFFRDGKLTAITVGVFNQTILDEASSVDKGEYLEVFTSYAVFTLTDERVIARLEENFIERKEVYDAHAEIINLILLVITAAAVDAINPCQFYVLIVLLSLVFFRIGRKEVLKSGTAFSTATFIVYSLMGLGLIRLIGYTKETRLI